VLIEGLMQALALGLLAWNAALVLGAGLLDVLGLTRTLLATRGRTWRGVLRGGVVATAAERVGRVGADGRLHVSDRWRVDVAERVLLELPCGPATIRGTARVWGSDRGTATVPATGTAVVPVTGAATVWTEREEVPHGAPLWVTAQTLSTELEGGLDGRVLLSVDDPRAVLARRIGVLLGGHALGVVLVVAPTWVAVTAPAGSLVERLGALGALGAFLLLLPLGTALRDAARLPHARLRHVRLPAAALPAAALVPLDRCPPGRP
jgi:hypothetical protein